MPIAFAPFEYFWIAPLSYAVLFILWRNAAPRRAFRLGLLYGLASFAAGLYWVYISIHGFGQVDIPLTLLLTGGLVAILALFVAATGWLAAKWLTTNGIFAWLGVLPALFVLTEWCRGWMFSGFGWLSAGYSQTDSWLLGLAPVFGLHGMSWLVLLTGGALVTLALGSKRERFAAAALAAALWACAFGLARVAWTRPTGQPIKAALVQGAVPQTLKWQGDELGPQMKLYQELTEASAGSRLIVWPEAALPTLYEYIPGYIETLKNWATANDSAILIGILRGTPEDLQNAVVAVPDTRQVYVKRHLVPFGEYFPVPGFLRNWLRLMSLPLPYADPKPGPADQPTLDVAGQRIGVSICYEDVFGAEQIRYLPAATLLVNVSNDAWFGDSIAPPQHLQISQLRAAEAGRYLLRATNTGITALIGPKGQVLSRLPQFQPGTLEASVTGMEGETPYARWGNYPVVIGALLLVLLPPLLARLKRPRRAVFR
ncbi:MAG TPA: apolipoprotein N-acyltransferase [Gammaproteobacteria bacterium]|nr:apolipoprotein N-acyltransferase [Gammaproteobacteria bacterium]